MRMTSELHRKLEPYRKARAFSDLVIALLHAYLAEAEEASTLDMAAVQKASAQLADRSLEEPDS